MTTGPIKIVRLINKDPLSLGHEHGETLRQEIKEIAEIRLERMCALSYYKKIPQILELAEEHLPILQNFDKDLFLELKGIEEASNVSLARLVILNNYTDMRDIRPKNVVIEEDPGGCSVIYSPGQNQPILGQTWDIHYSAFPYVIILQMAGSAIFSIAGCLGMTGLNKYGVGLAINNLTSIDAKVGIIWPALVRKALRQETAFLAKEEIMRAPLGSGHNYSLADEHNFYSIETSGLKKKLIYENADKNFFHTNHCLDSEMRKTHIIKEESNTLWRYQHLTKTIAPTQALSLEEVFLSLKSVSMEGDKKNPNKPATCGTIAMDINQRRMLACLGSPNEEMLKCPTNYIQI